uniref:Uncharacterized protein n=1 Tax=Nelumbo nucifera TaxID=4432 RepID=A0A822Y3D8_NELNU|nr:TPA_asm: hypothetical protein HUJ06_028403 [Nelumbo nucifera]DAD26937.1 TPA_asm: hypothetical protein HUJ06_028405 [Nelumbo nucifera]
MVKQIEKFTYNDVGDELGLSERPEEELDHSAGSKEQEDLKHQDGKQGFEGVASEPDASGIDQGFWFTYDFMYIYFRNIHSMDEGSIVGRHSLPLLAFLCPQVMHRVERERLLD